MIGSGEYRYEIRRGPDLIAIEQDRAEPGRIGGIRRSTTSSDLFEANAELDQEQRVVRVLARYSRGPFSRNASYEADREFMRGSVSAVGGRTIETAKLGRFREVDGGLVLFRSLILAHMRERGQSRWTGRVVTIDPSTLVARTNKQTCRIGNPSGRIFIYEARMGDSEEIEIDEAGTIVRITDNSGQSIVLVR